MFLYISGPTKIREKRTKEWDRDKEGWEREKEKKGKRRGREGGSDRGNKDKRNRVREKNIEIFYFISC